MKKIPIDQIVIVEGKYDKITLENVIDATIISCDGFELFKNDSLKSSLKEMAKERGAIILTDSDRAGAVIRSHLRQILQNAEVYCLYVPSIEGKEKRKKAPGKEGLLGVEGMSTEILTNLFQDFEAKPIPNVINSVDLYECGFSGLAGSKNKKEKLLDYLKLPRHLSNNALLKELNRKYTKEEFYSIAQEI